MSKNTIDRHQGLNAFSDLNLTEQQKILLITDGTVTELLETYLQERLQVKKISEHIGTLSVNLHVRDLISDYQDSELLNRCILLQGRESGRNCLYAESVIVLDNLPEGFRHDLMHGRKPIGSLWSRYQVETYKQIIEYHSEPAGELSQYFDINADELLLCRSYSVRTAGRVMMIISEKFPLGFYGGGVD